LGNSLPRGQSSYYAIKARYLPKFVFDDAGVTFVEVPNPAMVLSGGKDLATNTTWFPTSSNQNYVYLRKPIVGPYGNIPVGTCFKTVTDLKKAAWLTTYADLSPGAVGYYGWVSTAGGTQDLQADGLIGTQEIDFYGFLNATSYYRLDMGYTEGGTTYYGVLRGKAYTANITSITGPGVPFEHMLDDNPEDPVEALTYVTVVIDIMNWDHKQQSGYL